MSHVDKVVGVAGCGEMGLPMAHCLAAAGHEVWGFDVRACSEFGGFSAHMVSSAAMLAERCDVIFSVVRDSAQTETLCFSAEGLLKQGAQFETLVLCSTLSPGFARKLAQRLPAALCLLDAPMSGAPVGAENGTLSFMLAGDADRLQSLMPLFCAMGESFHLLGDGIGAGHTAKVLNNFSAAMSVAVTRQLLELAPSLGLSQRQLLDVLNCSSGQNWFSQHFEEISWAKESYSKVNTIGILEKDVACFAEASEHLASTELRDLRLALSRALAELKAFSEPEND